MYLNGILSVSTISPWVFVPIFIFLFLASLVVSLFIFTVPSSSLDVVMVTSPFSPSFTILVSPAANVSSTSYSVSNGISTVVEVGIVPIFIILGVASLVTVASIFLSPSIKVPSVWKRPFFPFNVSWMNVVVSSPFWPFWNSWKYPSGRFGSYWTSVSKGISDVNFSLVWVLCCFVAINWALISSVLSSPVVWSVYFTLTGTVSFSPPFISLPSGRFVGRVAVTAPVSWSILTFQTFPLLSLKVFPISS